MKNQRIIESRLCRVTITNCDDNFFDCDAFEIFDTFSNSWEPSHLKHTISNETLKNLWNSANTEEDNYQHEKKYGMIHD